MSGRPVAGSGRDPADFTLAAALADGLTYAAAAEAAGCSERTVQRRMGEAEFRGLVDEIQRERWRGTVRRVQAAGPRAVATLEALLGEDSERPGANVRLKAAQALLDLGHEIGVSRDLDARLEQLERAAGIDPWSGWKAEAA